MSRFVQGLSQGLELGGRVQRYVREQQAQPIEQMKREELYDLDRRLKEAQLEEYLDKNRRADGLRKVNGALLAANKGDYNNPLVIEAVNDVLKGEINQGVGGDVVAKRVRRFVPVPDRNALAIELEVEKKDGSRYSAPWTVNRSSDPKDAVLTVTPGEGTQALLEQKELLTRLEQAAAQYGDDWYVNAARKKAEEDSKPRVVGYGSALVVPDGKGGYRKAYENTRGLGGGPGGGRGLPGGVAQWKVQQLTKFLPEELATKIELAKGAISPNDKIAVRKYISGMQDEFGRPVYKTPDEVDAAANAVLDWVVSYSPDAPGLGAKRPAADAGSPGLGRPPFKAPPPDRTALDPNAPAAGPLYTKRDTPVAANAPTIVNRKTGERMVLKDGRWVVPAK